ncbi:MAG: hypothetical protein ACE363_12210 [Alphaproteobacteria bacterium]
MVQASGKQPVKIGWIVDAPRASFLYSEPKAVKAQRSIPLSARAVQACPAINEIERRLFEVPFPFDLHLSYERDGDDHNLFAVPEGTRLDDELVPHHVFLMKPEHWRAPTSPVIQIRAPYVFVADERVYINQLPPFLDRRSARWPGIMTAGRFPIDVWPRILSWGFEWTNPEEDLVFRRGDPWFYVQFETEHPDQRVELVPAENTPELQEYRRGLSDVVKYTSNTFSLFDTAQMRRPAQLLKERR